MKAIKFETFDEFDWNKGSYVLTKTAEEYETVIFTVLPCGHHFRSVSRVWRHENVEDENKITLSPSIFCHGSDGQPCWHGYLTNGEFIEV